MSSLNLLTAQIVSNYVGNSSVDPGQLPSLIASVRASLASLGSSPAESAVEPVAKRTPAQIRKSITDDGLVSFEDGKTYKVLKRSLTARGLTPEAYRQKWGLPADYPMVAQSVSLAKSAGAKARGLGRRAAKPSVDAGPALGAPVEPVQSDEAA